MKFIPYIKYLLLLLGFALFAYGVATYNSDEPRVVTSGLDMLLNFSAAIVVATLCVAVFMPLISIFQNPKSAVRSLVGILLMGAVFAVAYTFAEADPITMASGEVIDDVASLKFADTALYAVYISFAGVVLAMVGTEIYKIFK